MWKLSKEDTIPTGVDARELLGAHIQRYETATSTTINTNTETNTDPTPTTTRWDDRVELVVGCQVDVMWSGDRHLGSWLKPAGAVAAAATTTTTTTTTATTTTTTATTTTPTATTISSITTTWRCGVVVSASEWRVVSGEC